MMWSSNYVTRLSHLAEKAIRIIAKSPYNSHASCVFQKDSILKIDQIKTFNTSEFMFLFNRGQLPKAFSNYFEVVYEVHSHIARTVNDYRIDFAAQTLVDSL